MTKKWIKNLSGFFLFLLLFVGVSFQARAEGNSVYGDGVTITPTQIQGQAQFTVTQKTINEGTEQGKTYTSISEIQHGAYSKLTIAATSEAGLLPNEKYLVNITVVCDGTYPAYFDDKTDPETKFIFGEPGGVIALNVVTDEQGAFSYTWGQIWINTGQGITYVDFTDIEIILQRDAELVSGSNSVYGEGLSVVPVRLDGQAEFFVTQGTVTEGEKVGKQYNGIGGIQKGGYSELQVIATKEAMLEPNSEYEVVLKVACNGTKVAYYDTSTPSLFQFCEPGGEIRFTVTTDKNGEFQKIWKSIYLNRDEGLTYVDFVDMELVLQEKTVALKGEILLGICGGAVAVIAIIGVCFFVSRKRKQKGEKKENDTAN